MNGSKNNNKMKLKTKLINYINKNGKNVCVRNLKTKEVLNYSFKIKDFDYKLNEEQEKYVKDKLEEYEEEIIYAIDNLMQDLNSRQSVIQFRVLQEYPNCCISIQFIIRNSKLYSIVTSRSLDVKSKLECDIEITRKISDKICKKLNIELKEILFNVVSMHYYLK